MTILRTNEHSEQRVNDVGLIAANNQALADWFANFYHERLPNVTRHVALDDLIGEARLGLMEAARRYEPGRDVPFGSFAAAFIRGHILDFLNRESRESLPMYLHALSRREHALLGGADRHPQAEAAAAVRESIAAVCTEQEQALLHSTGTTAANCQRLGLSRDQYYRRRRRAVAKVRQHLGFTDGQVAAAAPPAPSCPSSQAALH